MLRENHVEPSHLLEALKLHMDFFGGQLLIGSLVGSLD